MYEELLKSLEAAHELRTLVEVAPSDDGECTIAGKRYLLLASNNYLGLAGHPKLAERAVEVIASHGVGAGAARLLSGHTSVHAAFEKHLAQFLDFESVLSFSSGYQANISVIPALVGPEDLIISDELNHASIIDGARLSKARIEKYPHRDTQALRRILMSQRAQSRRCLILTEGVFSMEGTQAPAAELGQLTEDFDAQLYIDDAHGLGVNGPEGRGTAWGVQSLAPLRQTERLIYVGTLGKALGSFGAFVAGTQTLKNFLINRARGFIFATALPAHLLAAADAALSLIETEPARLKQLRQNCAQFAEGLKELGFETEPEQFELPIQSVRLGSSARALSWGEQLFQSGIFARAIRPPTVPAGQSRLRFSLMATHTHEQLSGLLGTLSRIKS